MSWLAGFLPLNRACHFLWCLGLLVPISVSAVEELPEPLTLESALSRAEHHPELGIAMAELESARSKSLTSMASDDLEVFLNGRLQWIGPSDLAIDQSHDDHKVSLNAEKSLYDFGKSAAYQLSSRLAVASEEQRLDYLKNLKRLDIMRRYFDVLLADLAFSAEDEAIAIGFIRADRLEKRIAFGEVSELELLEAQVEYQHVLSKRTAALQNQRATRALLAESLDLPGKLSEDLLEPEINQSIGEIPEYKLLLSMAESNHPGLLAMNQKLDAVGHEEKAIRLDFYPKVKAYAEIADYSRTERGSDEWTVGMRVAVPLYQGGKKNAETAQISAQAMRLRADIRLMQAELRQDILSLWQKLSILKIRLMQSDLELDARDLYLDKSRALYEMDVQSDLGDAMIRFSRSRLEKAKVLFELAIVRAKLDLLTGGGYSKLTSDTAIH